MAKGFDEIGFSLPFFLRICGQILINTYS